MFNQMARRKRSKKNPYSSRGLDKFSSVVSELDARKKKIMSSAGANGVSLVRFMHSNSHDWTPVIVRQREEEEDKNKAMDKELLPAVTAKTERGKKEMKWWRWRPSYYLLAVMLLILVCFVISGRVFAICCLSVLWYLLPLLKGEENGNAGRRWGVRKTIGGA
ncbi:uncharacterized protein LOC110100185 [Dendrobium catenatum]|uniref:ZCF37 n=1 Tax=Dendrobium catenatum TaxID=906689 RepID=A0A2I0WG19_9ASPA|nr:uncharacterized protein LOC110100185 [Dendrobium catenatum]PKU74607.1 hypothetical protein MA16_Dca025245 [Dendrobium catenatum]